MPNRPIVALVPYRSPGAGKTRLRAAGLSDEHRGQLSAAMFADVVDTLRRSSVDQVVVAARGDDAATVAAAIGLDVHPDAPDTGSLDEAVAAVTARLGDAGSLLVVMADLPRLRTQDVEVVLATEAQVVVVATGDGGTGGLLRCPPNVMATAYGAGSADRHVELARSSGLTVHRLTTPGFHDDVDTLEDLCQLEVGSVGEATRRVLEDVLPGRPR